MVLDSSTVGNEQQHWMHKQTTKKKHFCWSCSNCVLMQKDY